MPNWNSNAINITGPAHKIRALWESAQTADNGEFGLLQALAPMPADLADTDADGVMPNWYNWRLANWGTKWDIDSDGLEFLEHDNGHASITGWANSAWSPPIEAFRTYADANDDVYLELKYFEPGMSFIGLWDSDGGDDYWEDVGSKSILNTTKEEDPVLYELLEEFDVWSRYAEEDFDEE